jgi:hypothetical protein
VRTHLLAQLRDLLCIARLSLPTTVVLLPLCLDALCDLLLSVTTRARGTGDHPPCWCCARRAPPSRRTCSCFALLL